MALVKVGSRAEMPPGSLVEVGEGEGVVAVCNYDGEFHAVDGICPHQGGSLGQGALQGRMIVCPWHAWEFDCVTGCNDYDSGVVLKKYTVVEEGGEIYVEIP